MALPALDAVSAATTVVSLYPLAICTAAVAIVLRADSLPRWLGVAAAVTSIALAANAMFVGTDQVPALLLVRPLGPARERLHPGGPAFVRSARQAARRASGRCELTGRRSLLGTFSVYADNAHYDN